MTFQKIEEGTWKPENEDDEITGILVGVEKGVGEFNSNLYHMETEAGKQIAVWGCTILDSDMSYINVGDKIKIIYKGTKPSTTKGRQPTKIYEVYKDVPDATTAAE